MQSSPVVHVVDDDEAVRQSLAFLLRTAQIEVKTYDSAMAFLNDLPRDRLHHYRCEDAGNQRYRSPAAPA